VALDAVYAADDLAKAGKDLKSAQDNLKQMQDLEKQGRATSDAVDDAETNVKVAELNVALGVLKLAAAADKTKSAAETWGFYVDLKMERSGDKTDISTNSNDEVASNLIANKDIYLVSGNNLTGSVDESVGNTNIKGNVISNDGDITIISKNDTKIEATKSTQNSNMKSEGFTTTVTLGASYGESSTQQIVESLMGQLSLRNSKSDDSDNNYTNTVLSAENGTLKINSFDDTSIKGADLLAQNIILNTQDDLTIESLQDTSHSKSKSTSFGVGGGQSGGNISYNAQRSEFNRDWVDDQTSVIGTDSVTINTGDNTDINGALVANVTNATSDTIGKNINNQLNTKNPNQENWVDGGNLVLNTNTLTFENITDTEKQESSAIGLGLTINNESSNNPSQQNNYYPKGSFNISLQDSGYEKDQLTKATIGDGSITTNANLTFDTNGNLLSNTGGTTLTNDDPQLTNLNRDITNSQEMTKDTITGDLDVNTTIDLRLLTNDGRKEIITEVKNMPENLIITTAELLKLAAAIPISPMAINRDIENQRGGTPQTILWGKSAVYKSGDEPYGIFDPNANNIGLANKADPDKNENPGDPVPFSWGNFFSGHEGGVISLACNYIVPGCNDMSLTHDNWGGSDFIKNTPLMLQISIIPAYPYNTYGLIGKPVNMAIDYLDTTSIVNQNSDQNLTTNINQISK